jgi:ATPase subunit of ABC transporter with duplicated ATPase domains
MGYFAQQALDVLDADATVIEQLQNDFPQDGLGSLRTLAGAFQFSGDDVDKPIRALSGGEKSRLAMARMLYDPPNFLVLDEPTNHLDLATKQMLVEALKDFEGTMIFVSHDRTFLRGLGSLGSFELEFPRASVRHGVSPSVTCRTSRGHGCSSSSVSRRSA